MNQVSHEIRTPLNGSINYIKMAIEDCKISKEHKDFYLNPAYKCCKL